MQINRYSLVSAALLALVTLNSHGTEAGRPRSVPVAAAMESGQVIVQYRSGASVLRSSQILSASAAAERAAAGPQGAATLGARLGLSLEDGRPVSSRMQVLKARGMQSAALAKRLAADADVEWAVVDGRRHALAAPNDPLYANGQTSNSLTAGQWYLRAPDSTVRSSVNAEGAWALTEGSNAVVVAVLDTGVRLDHPDLSGKLLSGYDFIADTSTANDGSGRDSDPSDPGDWITSTENASGTFKDCGTSSSSWHGTQVSGLVGAATNNALGMAGTAPATMILPVRVLGKCGGYDSDIIAGMRWAAGLSVPGVPANSHPAKVLNMSLGSEGTCTDAYVQAVSEIAAAGALVVAAAGNEGLAVGTPANCSGVLAVGGLRHIGTKSGFANLGPEVALSAPAGNCVNEGANDPCLYGLLSTTNAGSTTPTTSTYTDAYNYGIGTSFATPIVAGTAALMLAANPDLTPATLRSLMRSSARAFPSSGSASDVNACTAPSASAQLECYCTTSTCGAGMLDAQAAVQAAYNLNTQPVAEISASAATVRTGTSVTLSGAASFAGAGSSLSSYLWTVSSGSNLASFSGATDQASATLLTSAPGTVTVTLTVTNSAGSSDSATQTVLIQSPPTAVISLSDSTPVAGSGVTLIGSASAALGSATLSSYRWEITEGSTLAAFNGSSTNADSALTLSAAGTVTVKLTVTDNQGLSSSSSLSFTVAAAPAVAETGGGGGGGLGSLWAWALAGLAALVRRRQASH